VKWPNTHEKFEQHDAEGVDVCADGELFASKLLRGCIRQRPLNLTLAGDARRRKKLPLDAEITELGDGWTVASMNEDIFRLQILMDDAVGMGKSESAREWDKNVQGIGDRQLLLSLEEVPAGGTLKQFQHDPRQISFISGVTSAEDSNDVRMLEPRESPCFLNNSLS
jgi:hypothetical protein